MSVPYSESVLEHFRNPKNAGRLARQDFDVGTGDARIDASGERIVLQVRVASGRVREARFKAFGCPVTIACASFVSEAALERDSVQLRRLGESQVAQRLQLDHDQRPLARLALRALKEACEDFDAKQRP